MISRIACLGGIYSNHLALEVALRDISQRGVDAIYCLGDLGGFGPYPDRIFPLLEKYQVQCIQGNYDHSIGHGLDDCQCGYTDPEDNYYAQVSYDYTLANTSRKNRDFLRDLPDQLQVSLGPFQLLLSHGSPRRVNEFLWESTTSSHFLEHLARQSEVDIITTTHTGIKWQRQLDGPRWFVNVGVLGRPENDGTTAVWYTLLEAHAAQDLQVKFIPVEYDHQQLAREMKEERLPDEFIETILTGWWTTCLEVLPSKERRQGRY